MYGVKISTSMRRLKNAAARKKIEDRGWEIENREWRIEKIEDRRPVARPSILNLLTSNLYPLCDSSLQLRLN